MVSKNELKFIKSLKVKKYRVREKRFVIEGAKNVLELIKSKYEIDSILCSEAFLKSNIEITGKIETKVVSDEILAETGTFKSNNSCLAIARIQSPKLSEIDFAMQTFVLDGVNDPGNLGTIIRTLDWFGFDQIVCSEDSAELHNPKTIHSSMGSFARIKTFYTDLEHFLNQCSLPVYGAEMEGENLFKSSLKIPSAIVIGSESHGISEKVKSRLDLSISIPRSGNAESLNVGIATGIIASYLRTL